MASSATTTLDFQSAPVAPQGLPTAEKNDHDEKFGLDDNGTQGMVVARSYDDVTDPELIPSEEEMASLRKVPAPLP
jgi:hypothetical protein